MAPRTGPKPKQSCQGPLPGRLQAPARRWSSSCAARAKLLARLCTASLPECCLRTELGMLPARTGLAGLRSAGKQQRSKTGLVDRLGPSSTRQYGVEPVPLIIRIAKGAGGSGAGGGAGDCSAEGPLLPRPRPMNGRGTAQSCARPIPGARGSRPPSSPPHCAASCDAPAPVAASRCAAEAGTCRCQAPQVLTAARRRPAAPGAAHQRMHVARGALRVRASAKIMEVRPPLAPAARRQRPPHSRRNPPPPCTRSRAAAAGAPAQARARAGRRLGGALGRPPPPG